METTETNTSNHLMDTSPIEEVVSTIPDKSTPAVEIDPNLRPEWLPEKFKSPEDLAKSYSELEKRISTNKVPETYDWSITKEYGLEDVNEELNTELTSAFKSANFTQDQVKTAMALYADQIGKITEQLKVSPGVTDLKAEESQLRTHWGTDYTAKLETVRKFATTLPQGVLNRPLIDSAEGIKFLESLMESQSLPNPISSLNPTPSVDLNSIRENIRTMREDNRYKLPPGDPVGETHRQKLYSLYESMERLQKSGR
jgi:hypothetical protein